MQDTLSVQEAAELLGVSPATIRRRIKAGELRAFQRRMPQGFEWRIYPPNHPGDPLTQKSDQHVTQLFDQVEQPLNQVPSTLNRDIANVHSSQPDQVAATTDDQLASYTEQVRFVENEALIKLIELTDRLQQGNRELADRNEQLAGQLGFLQAKVQSLEEQIRLLTTEKEPEATSPTPQTKHPWWKRLFRHSL